MVQACVRSILVKMCIRDRVDLHQAGLARQVLGQGRGAVELIGYREGPGQVMEGLDVYKRQHHVHHVQGDDHGDAHLHDLGGQIQVALQVGGIYQVDDHIGVLVNDDCPLYTSSPTL